MAKDVYAALRRAAANWRESILEVGRVLVAMSDAGTPIAVAIAEVLVAEFGMPQATAMVAFRWASGEFGTEEEGRQLASKVNHSDLQHWTKETIAAARQKKHRVIDPRQQRVRELTFDEMAPAVVRHNTGPKGFIPVSDQVTSRTPEIRSFIATSFTVDEKTGRVVFNARGTEAVHMAVPEKLMRQAAEQIMQEA